MDVNPHYRKPRSEANSSITYTITSWRELLLSSSIQQYDHHFTAETNCSKWVQELHIRWKKKG